MSMIAFPVYDDKMARDLANFIDEKHGRIIRNSINRKGAQVVHVEFPDSQDIAADIMRQKLQHTYREAA